METKGCLYHPLGDIVSNPARQYPFPLSHLPKESDVSAVDLSHRRESIAHGNTTAISVLDEFKR